VGIFSREYKFYIKEVGNESIPLEDVIEPALGGPKWYAKLCPFVGKKKRAIDLYPRPIARTAQSCPAMLELFKNSFIIKFPCDVILETKEDGKYFWQKPSATQVLRIVHHPEEQVEFQPPLSSFIMIKFCLPFMFSSPNNKASFIESTYWKIQPYKIAPGILNFRNNKYAVPLHIITFFEKKNKIYEFKKGDPMVLLYTFHKSTLEIDENLDDSFSKNIIGRTFSHRWGK